MGWTFSKNIAEKKDIVSQILAENGYITKYSIINYEMWCIEERPGTPKQIVLFLLSKSEGCWGYKDSITEASHPFHYSCPLKYLKEVSVVHEGWRQGVIRFHQNKSAQRKLKLGVTVVLQGTTPSNFVVTNLKPLQGIGVDGKTYKLIRSKIVEVK
jgi:hypothetical protein